MSFTTSMLESYAERTMSGAGQVSPVTKTAEEKTKAQGRDHGPEFPDHMPGLDYRQRSPFSGPELEG